jgi:OOP family OmpA-OmpF porin
VNRISDIRRRAMKFLKLVTFAALSYAMASECLAEEGFPASHAASDSQVAFPEIAHATRPQGAFFPPQNIMLISDGMTKSQIYTLLNVPHFNEGMFGVHTWNYIFNFYTGMGREYQTCQYQIRFDKHSKVAGTWWRDQSCADLIARLVAPPPPQVKTIVETRQVLVDQPERAARTYSFTFAFDRSDISGHGLDVIHTLINDVSSGTYKRIVVTGFTDTMGTTDYNDALGARRGAAVTSEIKRELAGTENFSVSNIYSRSGRDLAVNTARNVKEELNRHVLIELY